MFYFKCKVCKVWYERRMCAVDPTHPLTDKKSKSTPPKNLWKAKPQTTTGGVRKQVIDNVPPPQVANYPQGTRFGLKVKLAGTEQKSDRAFWFNDDDGELIEAVTRDGTRQTTITVDQMFSGKHGGRKRTIQSELAAKRILEDAGYEILA